MAFSTVGKNQALDGITVDGLQLHSGDPGVDGTSNVISSTMKTGTIFAAAASSERALNAQLDWTGLTPSQSITWYSIWGSTQTVFKGRGQITSGDVAANAAGEYSLTTATKLTLTDS